MDSNTEKLKPQDDWKPERISRSYEDIASVAEQYIGRCKEGAKTREGYKKLHDEHVAKFHLYNYLYGRTFLDSPEKLFCELKRLRSSPPTPPRECFDGDWFTSWYVSYVRGELNRLVESAEPESQDTEDQCS